MSDFPRMLYQAGGPHDIHGGLFDYLIVESEEELTVALGNGWHMTTDDARAADLALKTHRIPAELLAPVFPPDDAPPTRDELERKAAELGIAFDGRTSDSKLAGKIAEALQG